MLVSQFMFCEFSSDFFEAMQVLRDDHQGIAVYVAPSKALVNQVSAEIYARFGSKVYPAHSKQELRLGRGIFTKTVVQDLLKDMQEYERI